MRKYCLECGCFLSQKVFDFSLKKYNVPLCINDQRWIDNMKEKTTPETIKLYFALRKRNVPAEIEKFDGHKRIDIAIPKEKINIEVDGQHHNYDRRQAFIDLQRTYHSFLKGYYTLRIPNCLVYNNFVLEKTADFIVGILNKDDKIYYNKG